MNAYHQPGDMLNLDGKTATVVSVNSWGARIRTSGRQKNVGEKSFTDGGTVITISSQPCCAQHCPDAFTRASS